VLKDAQMELSQKKKNVKNGDTYAENVLQQKIVKTVKKGNSLLL